MVGWHHRLNRHGFGWTPGVGDGQEAWRAAAHGVTESDTAERLNWNERKHKERLLKAARENQQVTYNENPICLTADLSAETLQARREWQDIFKVLKGKNLQPRLLYPARISFNTQAKVKRIQYHQISFTADVKGTYIVKKYKRRKNIYKINAKQLRKWQEEKNIYIYLNIKYLNINIYIYLIY